MQWREDLSGESDDSLQWFAHLAIQGLVSR